MADFSDLDVTSLAASWSMNGKVSKHTHYNIMTTDSSVFVPGDGAVLEPSFINGINIYFMNQFNRVSTRRPVFWNSGKYIHANDSVVHVHNTGLQKLIPGMCIAVVPVMCSTGTNKRYEGKYFLETVNAHKYGNELSSLIIALRAVLENYEDVDVFWKGVHSYLSETLNNNTLWFDLTRTVTNNNMTMTPSEITQVVVNTVNTYWKDGIGAGLGDSSSMRPTHYTSPLLTSKSVLADLAHVINLIPQGEEEEEVEDTEERQTITKLKKTGNAFKAMRTMSNFIKNIEVCSLGVIQRASSRIIQPGSLMVVLLTK